MIGIAAVAAYYIYNHVMGSDDGTEAPSCKSAYIACMKRCDRTTSEAPERLDCQRGCQRDEQACERG